MRLDRGRITLKGDLLGPISTLGMKLPLGTLALLIGAVPLVLFSPRRVLPGRVAPCLPGAVLLAFLCGQTGLNWAMR